MIKIARKLRHRSNHQQISNNKISSDIIIVVINKDIEETVVSRHSESHIRTSQIEETNLSEDNILSKIILDPVTEEEEDGSETLIQHNRGTNSI